MKAETSFFSHVPSLLPRLRLWTATFHTDWLQKIAHQYNSLVACDELVVEDVERFGLYLQSKFFQANQAVEMLYLTLSFLFLRMDPTILDRSIYICAMLIGVFNVSWLLPYFGLSHIKTFGMIELLRKLLLNVYLHHNYPLQLSLINSAIFFSICFSCTKFWHNLMCAGLLSVINVLFIQERSGSQLMSYVVYYMTCIFISHCYHLVIDEFSKRFDHALQHAQTDLRNKGLFVSSVTHDLKNPISSIQGAIDLLKTSRSLSEEDTKELTTASYSCQILLYLIGNITDITKMEAGKFDIDRVPMSIEEELKKIVEIETELSKQKSLSLYTKVLTPLPSGVYGDPMRFAQVMINLIGNAIKFTSHGYVGIVLRWATNVDEAKNYEYLEADETGKPSLIPPESFFTGRLESRPRKQPSHTSLQKLEKPRHKLTADQSTITKYDVGGEEPEVHKRMGRYETSVLSATHQKEFQLSLCTQSPLPAKGQPSSPPVLERSTSHQRRATATCQFDAKNAEARTPPVCLRLEGRNPFDLSIGAASREFEDGILVVDVIDSGVGMSKEETLRLFQPFVQANQSIKRQFGGTGLGLWITKQLLTLMSSLIQVDSQQKKGTRFRVTMPFKVAAEKDGASSSSGVADSDDVFKIAAKVPGELLGIRSGRLIKFSGTKRTLKEMRVLILEDDKAQDDGKLSQVINQLRETDIQMTYAGFDSAITILERSNYNFLSIVVIASTPTIRAKRVVTRIMKTLNDVQIKQIPIAVLADLTIQNEFMQITSGYQLAFPMSNEALIGLLLKMRMRASRKHAVGGYYQRLVEELYAKYNVCEEDSFEPYNAIKVLLADDNPLCNSVLRRIIEKLGKYRVHSVSNGADACEFYEENADEVNLVILDIEMPEKNGIEVAEWIRKFEQAGHKRSVPIIGMSGHEGAEVKRLCLEAGMNELLCKPIGRQTIINLLKKLSLK